MPLLNERIKRFKQAVADYVQDKRIKDPTHAYNLVHNLPKIDVGFEFECYLDMRDAEPEKEEVEVADFKDVDDDLDDWKDAIGLFKQDKFEYYLTHWYFDVFVLTHTNTEQWEAKAKEELAGEGNVTPSPKEIKSRATYLRYTHLHKIPTEEILEHILNDGYTFNDLIEHLDDHFDIDWNELVQGSDYDWYVYHEGVLFGDKGETDPRKIAYNEIAKTLTRVFKAPVEWHTSYHGIASRFKRENPHYWFVENDGSLGGYYDDNISVEIISPHVNANKALDLFHVFKDKIFDHFDGITNSKCGLHFNIFTNGLIINPVKLLMLLDEEDTLHSFNRVGSDYAIPHTPEIKDFIEREKNRLGTMDPQELKTAIQSRLNRDKMMAVNIRDYDFNRGEGRLEFRIMGSDYMGKYYEKTVQTIKKFVYLVAVACEPEDFARDYTNKLRRMIPAEMRNSQGDFDEASLKSSIKRFIISPLTVDFTRLLYVLSGINSGFNSILKNRPLLQETINFLKVLNSFYPAEILFTKLGDPPTYIQRLWRRADVTRRSEAWYDFIHSVRLFAINRDNRYPYSKYISGVIKRWDALNDTEFDNALYVINTFLKLNASEITRFNEHFKAEKPYLHRKEQLEQVLKELEPQS